METEHKLGWTLRKEYSEDVTKAKGIVTNYFEKHQQEMINLTRNGTSEIKVAQNEIKDMMWASKRIGNFLEYIIDTYDLNVEIFQGGMGRDYLDSMTFSWKNPTSMENCNFVAER